MDVIILDPVEIREDDLNGLTDAKKICKDSKDIKECMESLVNILDDQYVYVERISTTIGESVSETEEAASNVSRAHNNAVYGSSMASAVLQGSIAFLGMVVIGVIIIVQT